MHPRLKTSDFDYQLPKELIAQKPASSRDGSRLMAIDRKTGRLEHRKFSQIIDYLHPSDLLVLNDTKIISARLFGRKYGSAQNGQGAKVEILLNRQVGEKRWEVLARPAKRLQLNTIVQFSDNLFAEVIGDTNYGGKIFHFACNGKFNDILDRIGKVPLPPYIRTTEQLNSRDALAKRYQTVYASKEGATAAPTAGLHFTPELLKKISDKGVQVEYVTLHTGIGTFKPVKTEYINDHKMHSEQFKIDKNVIERIRRAKGEGRRIIAVGTTVVRLLETLANKDMNEGDTDLFITPGHEFKIVDAMITNFHFPRSTLIMMVSAFAKASLDGSTELAEVSARDKSADNSAFAGMELIKRAYAVAVAKRYRFFSFGDAMFIK